MNKVKKGNKLTINGFTIEPWFRTVHFVISCGDYTDRIDGTNGVHMFIDTLRHFGIHQYTGVEFSSDEINEIENFIMGIVAERAIDDVLGLVGGMDKVQRHRLLVEAKSLIEQLESLE
jgi:hypothetical protein